MKTLDKHNILELIGRDRRKYHSAIITCYAFDFNFFEERVMTSLRHANIKNVNVLVDGKYLESTLEFTTGKEFRHSPQKNYSLTPIYTKGVFHSKIMYLVGQKQGLLIIGSGNLSGSGICSNDEIWSAFHLNSEECEHIALFKSAWDYLMSFKPQMNGFVRNSIDWMYKYSIWLNNLQSHNEWIALSELGSNIQFVSNSENGGIFKQINDLIPNENLKCLTVISPFYDNKGGLLEALKTQFRPLVFNAVIQSKFGTIPAELQDDSIRFFEWSNCFENSTRRLHAKLFHFQFDEIEYLLFGSPNVTLNAMGTNTTLAKNEEAGVLMSRKSKHSFLAELGIKIPNKSISLASIDSKNKYELEFGLKLEFRIIYAEINVNQISIHFREFQEKTIQFVFYNTEGIEIQNSTVSVDSEVTTLELHNSDSAFKVCIFENDIRVSNFSLIHKISNLLKNNPDPKLEKFDEMLNAFQFGDGIADLLSHLSYNWADDENEESVNQSSRISSINSQTEIDTTDKKYEQLKADEFNKIDESNILKQHSILSSNPVKLAEFLSALSSGLSKNEKEDFTVSEEAKLLGMDEEETGEGEEVKTRVETSIDWNRENKAIKNYYINYDNTLVDKLEPFYNANGNKKIDRKVTITALSNFLISLEVSLIYYNKPYYYTENNVQKKSYYLIEGTSTSEDVCLKSNLCDIFGRFLILCTAGFEEYNYELINLKLLEKRRFAFRKILFLIFNVSWSDQIIGYRNTLILNSIHFLNPDECNLKEWKDILISGLSDLQNNANYMHSNFMINYEDFFQNILPKYETWLVGYKNPELKSELTVEIPKIARKSIIFKSNIGFVELLDKFSIDNMFSLDVRGSGFLFYENDRMLKDLRVLKSVIKFDL